MDNVKQYLNQVENEMISALIDLVKQESTKKNETHQYPFGKDIHNVLNYFSDLVKVFNFDRYFRHEDYYSWVEIGDPELPLIGIVCHIDVVNYVKEDWKYNPHGELIDDIIYGRGVVDNKGPIIQILYAMQYIKQNNIPLRIRLIIGADEEKDFKCVKKYIENKEEMPDYGFIPDAKFPFIISEKGLLNMTVSFDEEHLGVPIESIKGGTGTNITPNYSEMILKNGDVITAEGIAAHVANPSVGDNAIISMIRKVEEEYEKNSFIDKFMRVIHDNYLAFIVNEEEIIVKPTFIEKKNQRIEITFDTRIPVDLPTEKAKRYILDYFGFDEESIERINQADGYEYSKDHPVIEVVSQVYEDSIHLLRPDHKTEKPLRIAGTTYGKYFRNCIVFGPGFPDEHSYAHREDERIRVKSFMDGTYIYIKLLEELGKRSGEIEERL